LRGVSDAYLTPWEPGRPEPGQENSLDYIDEAIKAGFKVEVDLRRVGDQFFFGHDYPQYPVDSAWIFDRETRCSCT
jgi:hypothetical protein